MTEVKQCDQCKITDVNTGKWIKVELGEFAQPGDRGGHRLYEFDRNLDFCSYACLTIWSDGRRQTEKEGKDG